MAHPTAEARARLDAFKAVTVKHAHLQEVDEKMSLVSCFECPTCLATRDIQPKGGRVKFPWHPKRTTNTPNQGLRWVKGESAWGLSE